MACSDLEMGALRKFFGVITAPNEPESEKLIQHTTAPNNVAPRNLIQTASVQTRNFYASETGLLTNENEAELWLPAGSLSRAEALQVYQDGYVARLTTSLGENFESVWKYVGDEIFFDLAKQYIAETPSKNPNLNLYGQSFPEFLEQIEAVEEHPFLPDMARLDWNKAQLFHQPTVLGLSAEKLAGLLTAEASTTNPSGRDQTFRFVDSVHFIPSAWNLFSIWKSIHKDESMPDKIPSVMLLWKRGTQVMIQGFDSLYVDSFRQLSQGAELEKALEGLSSEQISFFFQFLAEESLLQN